VHNSENRIKENEENERKGREKTPKTNKKTNNRGIE
jgi:hypothetical protein